MTQEPRKEQHQAEVGGGPEEGESLPQTLSCFCYNAVRT